MFDAGIMSLRAFSAYRTLPESSDFTSTPQSPCAITGAPKILSRSEVSVRSARRLGFGAVVGGVWVQPGTTRRLAAATQATAFPRRSLRHEDHKEIFVIFVIFVAFVMKPWAVTGKLLQCVDGLEDPVQCRGLDLCGGRIAVAPRVGVGVLAREGDLLVLLAVFVGETDRQLRSLQSRAGDLVGE